MQSARILKRKINGRQLTVGLIATNHLWFELLEISRNAGMDYLIIDQEHVGFDERLVCDMCSAARQLDFPVLIRPAEPQFSLVRRALDKGACGLLLPMVESTAVLDEVQSAAYTPPRGKRRPGGPGVRWVTALNHENWVQDVEDDLIILPQIESLAGLEAVEQIAAHPLTTAIAIGPYDLSSALGVCWQPDHPRLLEAQQRIRAAGEKAGKNMWMIGHGPTLAQRGFTFLCVGEPTGTLEATLKANTRALHAGHLDQGPVIHKVD
jgi:2-keto-3-deoxy-L-rhamnonate aldolase RhmA